MGVSIARRTRFAGLAFASAISLLAVAAHAEPQTATAAEATSDPTLRPNTPMPAYPRESRARKEAGVVRVTLCVEADGSVGKADLRETSGFPNLDNAVLKWVKDIRFNPAMKDASAVAVCDVPFKYEFLVVKGPPRQQQTTNPFDIGPATGIASGP